MSMNSVMQQVHTYLLKNGSASVYELKQVGVRNPATVVSWLRESGFNITTYYQKTIVSNGHIIYGHYRYKLKYDLFRTKKASSTTFINLEFV